MRRAIIVDVDGTLSMRGDRRPYDYSSVIDDEVNEPVALVVRAYKAQYRRRVIVVSGREVVCGKDTKLWLKQHEIPCDDLWMRPVRDYRQDAIIKAEIYERHVQNLYVVDFVLDDRDQTVQMWRDLGLVCLQVAPGNF